MACCDCEDCSKSIEYGGKCKRFEYDCPFILMEKYEKKKVNKMRTVLENISKSIDILKELDDDYCVYDEIASLEYAVSELKDKTDKNLEKEWQEINK